MSLFLKIDIGFESITISLTSVVWLNHSDLDLKPIFMKLFVFGLVEYVMIILNTIMITIINFIWLGITIICSGLIVQLSSEPDGIIIILIVKIGKLYIYEWWFDELGNNFIVILLEISVIRIEYSAVNPTDVIISIDKIHSSFDDIIFSIIISFEKNPDMKGIPINDILVIPNTVCVSGIDEEFIPIIRISWYEYSWIIVPAHKNIVDLKKAWIIKWKKARLIALIEIENIIIAICLNVDNAMIFLRSCSQLADILAYSAVMDEVIIKIDIVLVWMLFINRNIMNTPAVTRVDEWTKAEMGVGAAIAAGSHAENGNCALFEHAAISNNIIVSNVKFSFIFKFQFFVVVIIAIDIKIIISPIRLLNKVIDPEAAVE